MHPVFCLFERINIISEVYDKEIQKFKHRNNTLLKTLENAPINKQKLTLGRYITFTIHCDIDFFYAL